MENKLFIAIPTMGTLQTRLASFLLKQENVKIQFSDSIAPVSKARNTLIQAFLKSDADHLLMIDSDTIPPVDVVSQLQTLLKDCDVATGITPIIKKEGRSANVFITTKDVEKFIPFESLPTIPFEVKGCGASCIMIKRSILEKISEPYCKTIEFDNGAYCSEDLYLCEQITNAGGKIMAHPLVICGHVKTIIL